MPLLSQNQNHKSSQHKELKSEKNYQTRGEQNKKNDLKVKNDG